MKLFLDNPTEPVKYNSIFREYYIDIQDDYIITLEYCPWCGNKLPKILRIEYFDTLEREYSLDLAIDEIKNNKNIPEEFRTDEWWKKRGL